MQSSLQLTILFLSSTKPEMLVRFETLVFKVKMLSGNLLTSTSSISTIHLNKLLLLKFQPSGNILKDSLFVAEHVSFREQCIYIFLFTVGLHNEKKINRRFSSGDG